jgi:hypothetical protein
MAQFWHIPFLGGPLDGEHIEAPLGLILPTGFLMKDEVRLEQEGYYSLRMEHEESPYFETDPVKYVWTPEPPIEYPNPPID